MKIGFVEQGTVFNVAAMSHSTDMQVERVLVRKSDKLRLLMYVKPLLFVSGIFLFMYYTLKAFIYDYVSSKDPKMTQTIEASRNYRLCLRSLIQDK